MMQIFAGLIICFLFAVTSTLVHGCPEIQCEGANKIPCCDGECPPPKTCSDYLVNASPEIREVEEVECICKDNYVLDDKTGDCIPPFECEGYRHCTEDGEVWTSCATECSEETCATYAELREADESRDCDRTCQPNTCICRRDLVRNDDGKCVRPDECPREMEDEGRLSTQRCEDNEVWLQCVPSKQKTCDDVYLASYNVGQDNDVCVSGCACAAGYVRNYGGDCIPEDKCQVKCDTNEVHTNCGTVCEPTCRTELGLDKRRICTLQCILNTCVCASGHVRDYMDNCIPLADCPDVALCGKNEDWTNCGAIVQETCNQRVDPPVRPDLCVLNTCKCKPGYVRDNSGNCISKDSCPTICGQNEYMTDCGSSCGNSCDEVLGFKDTSSCVPECVKDTCECLPGYYRDDSGVCVLLAQCRGYKQCSEHEEWTHCGSKCADKCPVILGMTPPSYCSGECIPNSCKCRAGYARDSRGKCIPAEACPQAMECFDNEEWTNCALGEEPTCDNVIGWVPSVCIECDGCRRNTCVCKPGHVRNRDGVCVEPKYCPNQLLCGENEVGVLLVQDPEVPVRENYTCYCQDGYARDRKGSCVRATHIPRAPPAVVHHVLLPPPTPTTSTSTTSMILKCEQDEVLVSCGRNCYETCGMMLGLETVTPCDDACYRYACECRPGYVRLTKYIRKCVPRDRGTCGGYFHVVKKGKNNAR